MSSRSLKFLRRENRHAPYSRPAAPVPSTPSPTSNHGLAKGFRTPAAASPVVHASSPSPTLPTAASPVSPFTAMTMTTPTHLGSSPLGSTPATSTTSTPADPRSDQPRQATYRRAVTSPTLLTRGGSGMNAASTTTIHRSMTSPTKRTHPITNDFRQGVRNRVKKVAYQETISAYCLEWEDLRGWLSTRFRDYESFDGGLSMVPVSMTESAAGVIFADSGHATGRRCDRYKLQIPEPLTKEDKAEIQRLRSDNTDDEEDEEEL